MRFLTSPRLALLILAILGTYCGVATWLPWVNNSRLSPPVWAEPIGLDHPFMSTPFLLLVCALFLSTAACTLLRITFNWKLIHGYIPPHEPIIFPPDSNVLEEVLYLQGYRKNGKRFFRNRPALLGSSVLHIGILIVLAGVAVQQGFQDTGMFQLAEGEIKRLDSPGSLITRSKGYMAPDTPPALEIAMESFDPFFKQKGYAPDRMSRLIIHEPANGKKFKATIDRASGYTVGPTQIYQAIPTGYALQIEISGKENRAFHLQETSERAASGEFVAPGGRQVRFVLESEKPLNSPTGAGRMHSRIESHLQTGPLQKGVPFLFGNEPARIVAILRWAGFSYSRSPGIGIVFSGFGLILAGCMLLVFPAGVAMAENTGSTISLRLYQTRGTQQLVAELLQGATDRSEGGAC